MPVADFSYNNPAHRLVFGWGARESLKAELALLSALRPLVVCSPRGAASPEVQALCRSLALDDGAVYGGATTHAPLESAYEGCRRATALRADCLIAFGGGSASDLAKGIALACAEEGRLLEFVLERAPDGRISSPASTRRKLPIIALPTTVSGAEVTPGFALTDAQRRKILFRDATLSPAVLIYDPELMHGVPLPAMAASTMNALAHGIEALYSKQSNPVSSLYARDGVVLLYRSLKAIAKGDRARAPYTELALGAYYAGIAIVNARTGLHHAICHKLAPATGLTHGLANAIMLPRVLEFNLPAARDELTAVARLLGQREATAQSVIAAMEDLSRRAGLPARLRDVDISRDIFPDLAQNILREPGLAFNPRVVRCAAEIEAILDAAW
jgi:alcohol dehydrogenase class IV